MGVQAVSSAIPECLPPHLLRLFLHLRKQIGDSFWPEGDPVFEHDLDDLDAQVMQSALTLLAEHMGMDDDHVLRIMRNV